PCFQGALERLSHRPKALGTAHLAEAADTCCSTQSCGQRRTEVANLKTQPFRLVSKRAAFLKLRSLAEAQKCARTGSAQHRMIHPETEDPPHRPHEIQSILSKSGHSRVRAPAIPA